jgi:hypothetical protein
MCNATALCLTSALKYACASSPPSSSKSCCRPPPRAAPPRAKSDGAYMRQDLVRNHVRSAWRTTIAAGRSHYLSECSRLEPVSSGRRHRGGLCAGPALPPAAARSGVRRCLFVEPGQRVGASREPTTGSPAAHRRAPFARFAAGCAASPSSPKYSSSSPPSANSCAN